MDRLVMAAAALVSLPTVSIAQTAPSVAITLKPITRAGDIVSLEVTQQIDGYWTNSEPAALVVASRIALTKGQNYTEGDITARDDLGPLPLRLTNIPSPAGQPLDLQRFSFSRQPKGVVNLRYTAQVTPAMSPRPPGPSYDLRGQGGGFGGAFFSFLLLPANAQERARVSLGWNLAALPAGSAGITTSGAGDWQRLLRPAELNPMFFLAGSVLSYTPRRGKFRSYWIGSPPFDAEELSRWSNRAFDMLQQQFRDSNTGPYTLLMRPYANPRDGGGATRGGFMLEYGRGKLSDDSRKIMFTHEMVHHFVPALEGDSNSNAWFVEGLAEFFKARLPYRTGMLSLDAFGHEIGVMTNAYYTSSMVNLTYDEVGRQRWAGGDAQLVPYNRGFMYFVDLNAKIVAKSRGRRSLDDLVLAMLERRRAGQSYDEAAWRKLLGDELGEAGTKDLDDMLAGQIVVPASDAFGSCFRRIDVARAYRPILGFSEGSLLSAPNIVRDLSPGSAAAAAGLRDGDEIVSSTGVTERIAHSASNLRLASVVTLKVKRGGETLDFKFSTVGPSVPEFRWERVPGAPKDCSIA